MAVEAVEDEAEVEEGEDDEVTLCEKAGSDRLTSSSSTSRTWQNDILDEGWYRVAKQDHSRRQTSEVESDGTSLTVVRPDGIGES